MKINFLVNFCLLNYYQDENPLILIYHRNNNTYDF